MVCQAGKIGKWKRIKGKKLFVIGTRRDGYVLTRREAIRSRVRASRLL